MEIRNIRNGLTALPEESGPVPVFMSKNPFNRTGFSYAVKNAQIKLLRGGVAKRADKRFGFRSIGLLRDE